MSRSLLDKENPAISEKNNYTLQIVGDIATYKIKRLLKKTQKIKQYLAVVPQF